MKIRQQKRSELALRDEDGSKRLSIELKKNEFSFD